MLISQAPVNNKQSSPFYCEPADAIRSAVLEVARRRNRGLRNSNRHSDPPGLAQWPANAVGSGLERIDSKVCFIHLQAVSENIFI